MKGIIQEIMEDSDNDDAAAAAAAVQIDRRLIMLPCICSLDGRKRWKGKDGIIAIMC